VGSYSFKKVSEFKYPGTMITQSNNMGYEMILKRIQVGNKRYYALGNLHKTKSILKETKSPAIHHANKTCDTIRSAMLNCKEK